MNGNIFRLGFAWVILSSVGLAEAQQPAKVEKAPNPFFVLGHSEKSFIALALQDIVDQGGLKLKVSVEAA